MNRLFLTLSLLLFIVSGQSQSFSPENNFLRLLDSGKYDSSAAGGIGKAFLDFYIADHIQAIEWARSQSEAINLNPDTISPYLSLQLGIQLDSIGQVVLAEDYILASKKGLEDVNVDSLQYHIQIIYGFNLLKQGKMADAFDILSKTLEQVTHMYDTSWMIQANMGLGHYYSSLTDFPQALIYFQNSLQLSREISDSTSTAYNLTMIGDLYHSMSDFRKAANYQLEALNYSNGSIHVWTLINLSGDYYYLRMKDSTMYYINEAIRVSRETRNPFDLEMSYGKMASYLFYNPGNDSTLGLSYIDTALQLAIENNSLIMQISMYNLLSHTYARQGDFKKAYHYFQEFFHAYDSSRLMGSDFQILTGRFNQLSAHRNRRISYLSQEKQKQEIVIQRTQILVFSLGLLLLFSILLILVIRFKNLKRVAELNQKLTRFQMNPHFIFNSLNSLQGFILDHDPKSANKYLSTFSKLMRSTLENSYHNIVPVNQEMHQVELYLQLESMRFNGQFRFTLDMDQEIDQHHHCIPSLIIQPFLENAIWHGLLRKESGDRLLRIRLKLEKKQIVCEIEDNGIGRQQAKEIKTGSHHEKKSLGTQITAERLALLSKIHKHHFQFFYTDLTDNSGMPAGTLVTINMPYIIQQIME